MNPIGQTIPVIHLHLEGKSEQAHFHPYHIAGDLIELASNLIWFDYMQAFLNPVLWLTRTRTVVVSSP